MTDGLLRVTKYSLSTHWRSVFVLTAVLVLPSLGLRLLAFLREMSSDPQFMFTPQFLFWGFHFAFLFLIGGGILLFCLNELLHKQKLMLRMPVATAQFVSGLILSTLVILLMVSLVSNGVYRLLLFDADGFRQFWPVTGPTLFLVTLIVVAHCIYWNLQRPGFARLLFWFSFVIGMCYWLQSRYYPDGFNGYAAPWSTVTWPEFFTMLTVSVTAWIGAIRSCALVRGGVAVPSQMWERVWKEVGRLGHVNWASGFRKPDSVSSAFARLYWRDCCSSVMLYWVLLGSGLLVISFFSGTGSWDLGAIVFLFLFFPSFFMSLMLGSSLQSSHQMKGYLAVVPLSDRDIASILVRAILKLVVISVTSVLLFGLAGGSLVSLLLQGFETTRDSGLWTIMDEWRFGLISLGSLLLLSFWAMISNMTVLLWIPRRACYFILFLLPGVIGFFIAIHENVNLFSSVIGDLIFLTISVLIWSATLLAYVRAYRTELIHARALWLAALFCLVAPALYWNFWGTNELPFRVILSSLLVLAVTPFATIPLAVSWNRHR
ncbi:hypothetical protein Pan241w_56900 [Gimesia alba]|uniref:Uncharacterized protein n=1 Tax=Gimesia alba TaxID=2527973 RepID=A0A517RNY5_9PLAN|nr:hypothetical protein [Gimesia alba]QDT45564.1 hypothetical protein Pan241w_56900 [Gimesia alba]